MSLRGICAIVILLANVGCGTTAGKVTLPTPPSAPTFDTLIVPGQRIGPISLGMTGAQLLQTAGSPTQSTRFADGSWNTFSNGIRAFVDDDTGRVFMVATGDARYRTTTGIGFNASDLEIRSSYGAPLRVMSRDWRIHCYNGLEFSFAGSEHVTDTVVRPHGSLSCR